MKKLVLALLLGVAINAFAQDAVYPEKTGKIGYKFSMGDYLSDYTITYDDFGKKQAIDATSTHEGETTKSTTIMTEDMFYIVNHTDKQVMQFPADMEDSPMMAGEEEEEEFDIAELVESASGYSNNKQGTGTVLGKVCDIYVVNEDGVNGKYWIWKKYLLKAEFTSEGVMNKVEATEFKVNINVPSSTFMPPSGYTVTDMGEMMKQMQQMQQMYGMPEGE